MSKFFEFSQNNSGGSFVKDDKLCHRLFIEADTKEEACDLAEDLGVYFNGVDDGKDCPCCGDRWYRPWSDDGITFPYKYGSYTEPEAKKIAEDYKAEISEAKKPYRDRTKDIAFTDVENYAKYLADEYGWTEPDSRIFYKDGTIKEIKGTSRYIR